MMVGSKEPNNQAKAKRLGEGSHGIYPHGECNRREKTTKLENYILQYKHKYVA